MKAYAIFIVVLIFMCGGMIFLSKMNSIRWTVPQQDPWTEYQEKDFIHVRAEMVEISGQSYLRILKEDWNFKIPIEEVKKTDVKPTELEELQAIHDELIDIKNELSGNNKHKYDYEPPPIIFLSERLHEQTNFIYSSTNLYEQITNYFGESQIIECKSSLSNLLSIQPFKSDEEAIIWSDKNLKDCFHSNGVPDEVHQ